MSDEESEKKCGEDCAPGSAADDARILPRHAPRPVGRRLVAAAFCDRDTGERERLVHVALTQLLHDVLDDLLWRRRVVRPESLHVGKAAEAGRELEHTAAIFRAPRQFFV